MRIVIPKSISRNRDLLDLIGPFILLFQELPEDDELTLFTLADMTTLVCALPEGDVLTGLHTKEQMVQQTVRSASDVRDGETGTATLPRLVPRNGARFQCFDDAIGDHAVDVDAHVASPFFFGNAKTAVNLISSLPHAYSCYYEVVVNILSSCYILRDS